MVAATLQRATAAPAHPGALRVTGALTEPARLVLSTGQPPQLLLQLHFVPAQGLGYVAHVNLGADVADHMAAEALLPSMGAGAVVSVAGESLHPRTEHGRTVLAVGQPHAVLLLEGVAACSDTAQLNLLEA